MTAKYNVVTALSCVVCFCFFLSACFGNNHAGTGKQTAFADFNAIEKEYLDTLKKLNWPEGYSLPTKMEGNEEDRAASYQKGWGDTSASQLWECVWMKESCPHSPVVFALTASCPVHTGDWIVAYFRFSH